MIHNPQKEMRLETDENKINLTLDKLKVKVAKEKESQFKKKIPGKNAVKPMKKGKIPQQVSPKVKAFKKVKEEGGNDGEDEDGEVKKEGKKRPIPKGDTLPSKKMRTEIAPPGEKTDWSAMRKEKKELKEKRKKGRSTPEVYELSKEAKALWEVLRRGNCEPDQRKKLSTKIYKIIGPHIKKLVFAHDTVRVIETITAVGEDRTREGIFSAIKDDFLLLCKQKYSVHLIITFLKHGSLAHRTAIAKSLEGHVRKLSENRFGCKVLDRIQEDHKELWTGLAIEFYGKEFRILREADVTDFDSIVAKHPEKRDMVLRTLKSSLLKLIGKNRWDSIWFHKLLREYLANAHGVVEHEEGRSEIIEGVKDEIVRLVHTKDGSTAALHCIWYGNTKVRKGIVKALKGHVVKIARDEHGYIVLLGLFDSVDDTTLVSKAIIKELMDNFEELTKDEEAGSAHARKVFVYLVDHVNQLFFHPKLLETLAIGATNPFSKKDAVLRRKELGDGARESLLKLLPPHLAQLKGDNAFGLFILAILNSFRDDPRIEELYAKIAEIATESETSEFVEQFGAAKLLKETIKGDKDRGLKGQITFSSILLDTLNKEVVEKWLKVNRATFLFVFMIETEIDDVVEKTKALLLPYRGTIKKQGFVGAKILLKHLI